MAYVRRGKNGNGDYGGTYQKRTAWTAEEDEILKQQVARFGTHCWPEVAAGLSGRTSKACSLRWRCFLSPNIIRPNDEPFSPWEIAIIVLTQKIFGNKWNDIAAYLPMRCNNDIKNYFNLYLKDKSTVFSENCYLRSGYDLTQLLQSEPDEVRQRRQRLEAEKITSNNIEPLKAPPRSLSPLPHKPSTPTKPKKVSSSGPSSPGVRGGGVAKGAKPSRMGLAAGSLSAMMSEGYCLDSSYAAYSTDASGMYHSIDMSTAAGQAYLASMSSQGMYCSTAAAAAGYYGSAALDASGSAAAAAAAAGYGYATAADGYSMQLAATASGSYAAELQQHLSAQQQLQQSPQQQQGLTAVDASTSAGGCGQSTPGGFPASGLVPSTAGISRLDSMLPVVDKCATGTPALSVPKAAAMQHHSSPGCGGSPNDSSIYSPLMRFSIGDPDNILPVEPDHNDPIAAAMGIHWHRITSMDGTNFESLLSDAGELQAELQLNRMLAEYEPSVTSKPHSNASSAGTCTDSPVSAKPEAEHRQQDMDASVSAAAAAAAAMTAAAETTGKLERLDGLSAAAAVDPAAAAAVAVAAPAVKLERLDGLLAAAAIDPATAAAVPRPASAAADDMEGVVGVLGLHSQPMLSPAAVAGALAGGHHLHPTLHVDVPASAVSCGAYTQQLWLQQQQQQQQAQCDTAVSSPQGMQGHMKFSSSGGNGSSSGSPGSTHLSSVNITLGLVNPAIAHLVAGGERNATSAPCTMVAAYTPNGSYSPNPAVPKGAFTQGTLRPHSPSHGWQQAQQQQQQQPHQLQQRPSPFRDLQHQQQQMLAISDTCWGAQATKGHKQHKHSHLLTGLHSGASSHHQLELHSSHQQQLQQLQQLQHLHSSSHTGSPVTPAAAAGAAAAAAAAAAGGCSRPMRSVPWAGSSAGMMHSSQQQQSAAAVAAAAIHSTGRWSQHNEGPLPLDVTHEDEADLAGLFDGDADVVMTHSPTDTAPLAAAAGVPLSPMMMSGGAAVCAATAQDQAKLESLIQELQTSPAVPDGRLGCTPLNDVADGLMDMPAWGSSSSGSLDLLSGGCW